LAGQVKDHLGVRQQRRVHRPGAGLLRIGGDRGLDQDRGGPLPLDGDVGGQLAEGDGLDQPVHQHQAIPGGGDQGVAAQRGDRIPGSERVTQQRPQDGSDARGKPVGDRRVGEQQGRGHRLGGQASQQPQQPRRGRGLCLQPGHRQAQGGRHVRRVAGGCFAAGQQARAPVLEHRQVSGQGDSRRMDECAGLFQRQR